MTSYVGYTRVSTHEQNLNLQLDALKKYNCVQIFKEYASGAKEDRKELKELFKFIRPNDTLVVWRLDRLARSIKQLIKMVDELNNKNIQLISVTEHINTTTPSGKLTFHIFAAIAEFEKNIIQDRVQAGLAASRARGKIGGRPKKMNEDKIKKAQYMWDSKKWSINEICENLGVSHMSVYRYIKQNTSINNLTMKE